MQDYTHCLSILSAKLEDAGEVKAVFQDLSTTCQLTVERMYISNGLLLPTIFSFQAFCWQVIAV